MFPPRVLVTGANGLVGQAVVERLGRWPGADLLATGRAPRYAGARLAGGYTPLDVRDTGAITRVFQDFAPAVVVHCAGTAQVEACESDREACWALNVDATAAVGAACRRFGSRMVLLSTDFVFSGASGPYAETDRPDPTGTYGRTKLAAENALVSARVPQTAVVRTTLVYGAPQGEAVRSDFVRWVLRELSEGRPVRVASDQRRTPTYDADLADGVARVVLNGKTGLFHIAGREVMSPLDVAHRAAHAFGLDASLIAPATTAELHPGAPRPLLGGLLILRAESELGFRPQPLAEALLDLRARLGAEAPR